MTRPPIAPRLELTDGAMPAARRDGDGIALGGLRTPPVDVPVDVLSGVPGPNPTSSACSWARRSRCRTLASPSSTRAAPTYQQQYDAATDRTIQSGFVLEPDRDALLAFAQPSRVKP